MVQYLFPKRRRPHYRLPELPKPTISERGEAVSSLLEQIGLKPLDTVLDVPVIPFGTEWGTLAIDDPGARQHMLAVLTPNNDTQRVERLSLEGMLHLAACLRTGFSFKKGELGHLSGDPMVQQIIELLQKED